MSKKPKTTERHKTRDEEINDILTMMNHRDLQKACILRGLPPQGVVGLDHYKLVSWFYDNYEKEQDVGLLKQFDDWQDQQLMDRGYKKGDAMLHPALKFGYTEGIEDMDKVPDSKTPKLPSVEKKPKSEVDVETGIRSGTKKALTYELTKKKEDLKDIILQVIAKFPDAQEKSIRIWHKRALK